MAALPHRAARHRGSSPAASRGGHDHRPADPASAPGPIKSENPRRVSRVFSPGPSGPKNHCCSITWRSAKSFNTQKDETPDIAVEGFQKKSGGVLLSHKVSLAVPLALASLTSEFEMGSGVTSPL
jgi:hypothetical protein